MTRDHKFKRRVRERMARTGERYTSARRALLTGDDPHGEAVFATGAEATFPGARWHHPGVHPETTALGTLLAAAGVVDPLTGERLPEATLLLVGGGLGMGVFAFHYPEFSSLFLAGRHRWHAPAAWLDGAAARLGYEPLVWETGGAATAGKHLDAALAREAPVLAFVDLATLSHRGGAEAYHVVSVLGRDADGVWLGDVGLAPVHVDEATFAAARGRIRKDKHRLWALGEAAPLDAARLAQALEDGLRAWPAGLADPGMGSMSAAFKLDALATLADRVAGGGGKNAWDAVFPAGPRLLAALTSLHEDVLHRFTGGGLLRPLAAVGLRDAAARLERPALAGVADRYEDLGARWSALADAALPADVPALADWAASLESRWAALDDGAPTAPRGADA